MMKHQRARLALHFATMALFTLACGPVDAARGILRGLLVPPLTSSGVIAVETTETWYVEVDGDDSNPCTASSPCRTLNHVFGLATENDQIYIGAGTYRETEIPDSQRVIVGYGIRNLLVQGEGPSTTIIDAGGDRTGILVFGDGGGTIRDLTIRNAGGEAPGHCLSFASSARLTVENVVVEDCFPYGIEHDGGGELRLINAVVQDAHEDASGFGGFGVFSGGPLVVEDSHIHDNDQVGLVSEGGLTMSDTVVERNGLEGLVLRGPATATDVEVRNNARHRSLGLHHRGVAIQDDAVVEFANLHLDDNERCLTVGDTANVTVRDSLIENCVEPGIEISEMAVAVVESSIIQNTAGRFSESNAVGSLINRGRLTLSNSVVRNNAAGGILNMGELTVADSLFTGNRGHLSALTNKMGGSVHIEGGLFTGYRGDQAAVDNSGEMVIVNSTISGNPGAGIVAADGSLSLRYVTIADNGGYGLSANRPESVLRAIVNSLIADNDSGDCWLGSSPSPSLPLSGVNIDSDRMCRFGNTYDMSELMLDGLADNGGPTQTHALLPDSPALDAAADSCLPTDQRGAARPFGSACDVGAYEFNPTFGATAASLEVTGTPPAVSGSPVVTTDSLCTRGPGSAYAAVQTIEQGVLVELVGRGVEGGWWIVDSPRYPGQNCWIPQANVDVPDSLDIGGLPAIQTPLLPTDTPPPLPPNAPGQLGIGNVVCSAQSYVVPLSWVDAASNEDGYRVYRNGSLIATLGPNANQYTDSNAPATGLPVTYGVEAFNVAGASSRPEVVEPGCLF